jgi:hypothetical protein
VREEEEAKRVGNYSFETMLREERRGSRREKKREEQGTNKDDPQPRELRMRIELLLK